MAIVNTNFNSIFASVQLARIEQAIGKATVRISSGRKLNYASDDVSGVIAASKHTSQLSGVGQAKFNAADTENMLKVADSAMDEINTYLLEMRDLSLQAANDATLSATDFTNLDNAYQDYLTQIQNKAGNVEYNGINLLDGTFVGKTVQVGPNPADKVTMTLADAPVILAGTVAGTDITDAVNAAAALTQVDSAMDQVAVAQGTIGTYENDMAFNLEGLSNQEVNLASALSNIVDADMAAEITQFSRLQILSQSSAAVLAQANYVTERIVGILDKM